jgi:hypothetical protein
MADIELNAAYASVVEDDGHLFIGFAEGEDEDEGYILLRQPLAGGPIWFEVNDETFGAEDAISAVRLEGEDLLFTIRPEKIPAFAWAGTVGVRIAPGCESTPEALEALRQMLGPLFQQPIEP